MIHNKDVVRIDDLLHVVSDQDDRDTLLFVQLEGRFNDLAATVRIEHRSRLIEDNALRLHRHDTGDGDTLLLTTRETVRRFLSEFPHTNTLQGALHAGPDLLSRDADIFRTESDVLLDNRRDDLVVRILENHTGLLSDRKLILRLARIPTVY